MSDSDSPEARQRAIELLEANHAFPCEMWVSVIARNEQGVPARILAAASAALERPLAEDALQSQPSAQGTYMRHRLNVPCASAAAVLDLFARLRAVDGVVTVL